MSTLSTLPGITIIGDISCNCASLPGYNGHWHLSGCRGSITPRAERFISKGSTVEKTSENHLPIRSSGSSVTAVTSIVPPFCDMSSSTVNIYIGLSRRCFTVHKTFLCTQADYFTKMFSNGWKEDQEQAASLPDVEPSVFKLFLEWLYRGNIGEPTEKRDVDAHGIALIELYGFAELICLDPLKDYTMSLIVSTQRNIKHHFNLTAITHVYDNTAPGGRLRAFAAQSFHRSITLNADADGWTTDEIVEAILNNEDLSRDLILRMRGATKTVDDPCIVSICTWHVHPKNEQCKFKIVPKTV